MPTRMHGWSSLAVVAACVASSLARTGPVEAPHEVREIQPVRVAPILRYESSTRFEIGAWRPYAGGAESSLTPAFELRATGCPDDPTAGPILMADGSDWRTDVLVQNDIRSIAPGAGGAVADAWLSTAGVQADGDFYVAVTIFDDVGPDASCSAPASSFVSGVILGYGYLLGDTDGYNGDSHQGFYGLNATDLLANGITLELPADGDGAYQYAYGRAYDDVSNVLTLHDNAQPGLWCSSEWGGTPDRPGTSQRVAYWDQDQSGTLDIPAECSDTSASVSCVQALEPECTLFADVEPPCLCAANLAGDTCATNTNDFFAFLALYQAGDALADFFPGGGIDTNDFFAYLAAYQGDLNNTDCAH